MKPLKKLTPNLDKIQNFLDSDDSDNCGYIDLDYLKDNEPLILIDGYFKPDMIIAIGEALVQAGFEKKEI